MTFLLRTLRRFKHRVIDDECSPDQGPLMLRWHLLGSRGGKRALMIHCFLRSDHDRAFHDHPWDFVTFLLSPYREHTPEGIVEHPRFSIHRRPAEWKHWVETIRPETWTLVLRSKRRREWGFHTDHGWVDWRTYDETERCS
jgi:hypothetical protein